MFILRLSNKYKRILTEHQIHQLPFLVVLMVISGFMEMFSVSLVIPFMNLVMKQEESNDKWYVKHIGTLLHTDSMQVVLAFIAFLIASVYVVKNIYLVVETRIQQRMVSTAQYELQHSILEYTMRQPYEFFMGVNSGSMLNIINNYTNATFGLLSRLISMLSEFITSAMLIISLFVITPKISLLMSIVLVIILATVNWIIKPILRKAAEDNDITSQEMYKWILQSIQGIKEVKIMRSEDYFLANYWKNGVIKIDVECKNVFWTNVPRAMIEAVAMGAFFSTIGIHVMRGNYIGYMFSVMAAIAMAAVRLIPAANRISAGIASIAYSEPYLDKLLYFLENRQGTRISTPGSDHAIQQNSFMVNDSESIVLSDVTYSYPNGEGVILKDARIVIEKGESVGIVGSSGAGKTTAVDIMLGLLQPQSGEVFVDGVSIKEDVNGWLDNVGYIPQTIFMLDDSIRANVAFGVPTNQIDDNKVWNALDEAAIGKFVRGLEDGIDTQIGERGMRLSGGQKQRLGIARALYRNPQVLFFDEATSALDNETEKAIMEAINGLKGKKTIVIIAHRMTTIEKCDHVYRVEDGRFIMER